MGQILYNTSQVETAISEELENQEKLNAVWDDLKFPFTRVKRGANEKPDFDYTNNGLLFPQNDATEKVHMIGQFRHARKNGSPIRPHVHWVQSSALQPVWKMDYRWYENGATIPSSWITLTCNAPVFTYTTGSILQICSFPEIDGSLIDSVSSIIDIIFYRDDNIVTGDVLAKEFDIHFQIDQQGSRAEFTK